MRHTTRIGGGIAAVLLLSATSAAAAPTPLDDTIVKGTYSWDLTNDGGTDNGLPAGGSCEDDPGFAIEDAETLNESDAYDIAGLVFVDDAVYVDDDSTVDISAAGGDSVVTASTQSLSGLDVTVEHRYFARGDVARIQVTLANPSAATISPSVDIVHNWGSDDSTIIAGSSSGDTSFTAADRWLVTADDLVNGSDPINTSVYFGPGTVAEPPTAVSTTVFDCSDVDGGMATFDLAIAAGETQDLVFFLKMTEGDQLQPPTGAGGGEANADAVAAAVEFDAAPVADTGLFAGIGGAELDGVVNWSPRQAPTTTTSTTTSSTTSTSTTSTTVAPTTSTTLPPAAIRVTPTYTG